MTTPAHEMHDQDARANVIASFCELYRDRHTPAHPLLVDIYDVMTKDQPGKIRELGSNMAACREACREAVLKILDMERYSIDRINRFRPLRAGEDLRNLAIELHGGQTDMAGRPYIEHIDDVVSKLKPLEMCDFDTVACAYLHDTLEDCRIPDPATGDMVRLMPYDLEDYGVASDTVQAIELLTKQVRVPPPGLLESLDAEGRRLWKEDAYIEGIAAIEVSDKPVDVRLTAARVKRADNLSNMNPARVALLDARGQAYAHEVLLPRYARSLELLGGMIDRMEGELHAGGAAPDAVIQAGLAVQRPSSRVIPTTSPGLKSWFSLRPVSRDG